MHRHRRQPRSRTSGTLRASSRRRALAALGLLLLAASPSFAKHETVRYRLTVDVTWSPETHPGACPPNAHLSWLAGGTHDASVSFWQEGKLASPGLVQMAETGVTLLLEDEVAQAIAAAGAGSVLAWHHWFCPLQTSSTSCGLPVVELDVGIAHPLVTLVSMLGPTPDWFVGVSGLPLRDERGWIDTVVVDLRPYDGGTRDANAFELFGPLTLPPEPITLITERQRPAHWSRIARDAHLRAPRERSVPGHERRRRRRRRRPHGCSARLGWRRRRARHRSRRQRHRRHRRLAARPARLGAVPEGLTENRMRHAGGGMPTQARSLFRGGRGWRRRPRGHHRSGCLGPSRSVPQRAVGGLDALGAVLRTTCSGARSLALARPRAHRLTAHPASLWFHHHVRRITAEHPLHMPHRRFERMPWIARGTLAWRLASHGHPGPAKRSATVRFAKASGPP